MGTASWWMGQMGPPRSAGTCATAGVPAQLLGQPLSKHGRATAFDPVREVPLSAQGRGRPAALSAARQAEQRSRRAEAKATRATTATCPPAAVTAEHATTAGAAWTGAGRHTPSIRVEEEGTGQPACRARPAPGDAATRTGSAATGPARTDALASAFSIRATEQGAGKEGAIAWKGSGWQELGCLCLTGHAFFRRRLKDGGSQIRYAPTGTSTQFGSKYLLIKFQGKRPRHSSVVGAQPHSGPGKLYPRTALCVHRWHTHRSRAQAGLQPEASVECRGPGQAIPESALNVGFPAAIRSDSMTGVGR